MTAIYSNMAALACEQYTSESSSWNGLDQSVKITDSNGNCYTALQRLPMIGGGHETSTALVLAQQTALGD